MLIEKWIVNSYKCFEHIKGSEGRSKSSEIERGAVCFCAFFHSPQRKSEVCILKCAALQAFDYFIFLSKKKERENEKIQFGIAQNESLIWLHQNKLVFSFLIHLFMLLQVFCF